MGPRPSICLTRAGVALALIALTAVACRSTPIAKQAAAGNADGVQQLLREGASPDGLDGKSRRAIELAVHFQRVDVVRVLVAGGADLETPTSRAMPPLSYAAMRGNPEIVRILVEGGAKTDVPDRRGYTPLGHAIAGRKWESASILRSAGATLHTERDHAAALRALATAVLKRDRPTASKLLELGVDPDAPARKGKSARQLAQARRDPQMIALFSDDPASVQVAKAPAAKTPAAPKKAPAPKAATSSPVASSSAAPSEPPPLPSSRPPPPGLDFGRYHALVIGNNEYQFLPKLRTAVRDADAVADMLSAHYGHEVTQLSNASRAEILRVLGEYRRTLGTGDNLLIYYAGHGWLDQEGDRGYWLPIDATEDDVVNWIDNGSITSAVRAMEAKHVLVVADSCYSGKLTRGIHIVQESPGYIERLATRRARVVITSGGLEPVLDGGGTGKHSVFASAFLDVLEENRGVLEGHELFTRLRRPVAVNSDQVPQYSDIRKAGHDGGDFLFVRQDQP